MMLRVACLSLALASLPGIVAAQTPYSGTPAPVPGVVRAENFDNGGRNLAYFDSTTGNSGGAYRTTDVDIQPSVPSGFNIGWTTPGEWLKYTVNVAASGGYVVDLRVAALGGGNSLHVGFNGSAPASVMVPIPATGGWQTWRTVSVPVTLGAGVQQLTVEFDTGGVNLGPMTIRSSSTTTLPLVNVWVTDRTGTKRLAPQPAVRFVAGSGNSALQTITVVDSIRYQQIEGFGASMTDASAWVLSGLSAARQSEILTALFDRTTGLGLSFLRQPMGSSDFALNLYTYNDIDPATTDFPLARFSIDHDRAYILPMLRAARVKNPTIRIMASPWTAPAWMKTNRSLIDGGRLRPEAYATYASYFVRFLQGYAAASVPVHSLTVQNEPKTAPHYPSMLMTSAEQATFIGQHLGPALARAGLRQQIYAWDHNWETAFPLEVLANATARPFISGVAFHCYGGQPSAMSTVRNTYPSLAISLTECADGARLSFASKFGFDISTLLIGSLRNWARTVVKWNLILDQNGGPKLVADACRNCRGLVTVDTVTGTYSFNEDYYALAHVSRFVKPGAFRIDSTAFGFGGIENVAFVNPDGTLVILARNRSYGTITFQIRSRGATLQYSLPTESVATFKWTPQ
jgi:glucosylceramidase